MENKENLYGKLYYKFNGESKQQLILMICIQEYYNFYTNILKFKIY